MDLLRALAAATFAVAFAITLRREQLLRTAAADQERAEAQASLEASAEIRRRRWRAVLAKPLRSGTNLHNIDESSDVNEAEADSESDEGFFYNANENDGNGSGGGNLARSAEILMSSVSSVDVSTTNVLAVGASSGYVDDEEFAQDTRQDNTDRIVANRIAQQQQHQQQRLQSNVNTRIEVTRRGGSRRIPASPSRHSSGCTSDPEQKTEHPIDYRRHPLAPGSFELYHFFDDPGAGSDSVSPSLRESAAFASEIVNAHAPSDFGSFQQPYDELSTPGNGDTRDTPAGSSATQTGSAKLPTHVFLVDGSSAVPPAPTATRFDDLPVAAHSSGYDYVGHVELERARAKYGSYSLSKQSCRGAAPCATKQVGSTDGVLASQLPASRRADEDFPMITRLSTLSDTSAMNSLRVPRTAVVVRPVSDVMSIPTTSMANAAISTSPPLTSLSSTVGADSTDLAALLNDDNAGNEGMDDWMGDFDREELSHDWNTRFQDAIMTLHRLGPNTPLKVRSAGYIALLRVAKDFIAVSQMYGKIIISEAELPVAEKTIRPTVDLGGYLGGQKFIVCGILFKFAVDNHNLFGSDHAAAKVAGHDLRGQIAFLNAIQATTAADGVGFVHVPLTCLVDYRGYRLVASSVLPLNSSTIVYGSCDGGITMHNKHPQTVARAFRRVARHLNLGPHSFRNHLDLVLSTPADLEGHIGTDGRWYAVDFSRVFPPETPIKTVRNAHLSRLLRPEFLEKYASKPLCADAFSGFIRDTPGARGHNIDIAEATNYLICTLIPKFARQELTAELTEARRSGSLESFRITEAVHKVGINCRYLGLVRRHVASDEPVGCVIAEEGRWVILSEIVARVVKNTLRLRLREAMKLLRKPLEEPYRRIIIHYLNLLFGASEESERYWAGELKSDIRNNFICALHGDEADALFPLKPRNPSTGEIDTDFLAIVLKRLQQLMGLKLSGRTGSGNPALFAMHTPFNDTDLEQLPLRIKHMNVVDYAEGFFFHNAAEERRIVTGYGKKQTSPYDLDVSLRLCTAAIDRFEQALDTTPNNKDLLMHTARTYTTMLEELFPISEGGWSTLEKPWPSTHPAALKAMEYYLRAIAAPPAYDAASMFLYATFLERIGNVEGAEDYYLQALDADPNHVACLHHFGSLLSQNGYEDDAERFFVRSSANSRPKEIAEPWDPRRSGEIIRHQ